MCCIGVVAWIDLPSQISLVFLRPPAQRANLLSIWITGSMLLATLVSCQGLKPAGHPGRDDARLAASLEEAHRAWQIISREKPGTVPTEEAHKDYDSAVEQILRLMRKHEGRTTWARDIQTNTPRPWRLTFDPPGAHRPNLSWSLSEFARCEIASEVELKHFHRVVARDGLGVPVVLVQDNPTRVTRRFHPAQGEFLPSTAVLEFPTSSSGGVAEARLRFYDPLTVSRIPVDRRAEPLAENVTAALQFTLLEDYFDEEEEALGVLSGGEEEGHLFFLTPYDPGKIPVVFLHGVRSYPGVWKNMVNELLADPALRRRYQPVFFNYSPAMPIPASAACLRRQIQRARDTLDPEHDDAVMRRMVVVGHSMGGLLARMQVIDSGAEFWSAFFTASPEELGAAVDGDALELARKSLFFKHQSGIEEVIFICTPHRGSELADVNIVRTFLRLVLFLPRQIKRPLEALQRLPRPYLRPELRDFNAFGLAGPDNATTQHPFFKALAGRPILAPFHSIIAVGNGKEPLTDGVVPYWSAHLDGAVSETKVHHAHSCLWEPDTIEPVLRVLKATNTDPNDE
jgi:pimeloyl-ACP methyl ester carboxylesterase